MAKYCCAVETVVGDGEYPLMVQSTWKDKDANSFHLRVAPPRNRSSGGSGSVFQSPDRQVAEPFSTHMTGGIGIVANKVVAI